MLSRNASIMGRCQPGPVPLCLYMESNQLPAAADKEPEGPQQKKPKLERATTLAAAAAATAVEGELTLVSSRPTTQQTTVDLHVSD